MSNEITDTEAAELATLERVIETGMKSFTEVGNALLAIRDSRLYRAEYTTFEGYCRERWGMARRTAYQYIDAAEVVENVRNCAQIPQTESQARPLAQLPPERQAEAWQAATETAKEEGRKVTAKDVESQVEKRKEDAKKEETRNARGSFEDWKRLRELIDEAKSIARDVAELRVDLQHKIQSRDLCMEVARSFEKTSQSIAR